MTGINLFQIFNGLTFAALLFIVASGFTLIFGLLRIVNLAHGALYLIGGLIGYSTAQASGSFVLGILAAMAAVAVLGGLLDRGLLPFVRGVELRQVLLTLGVAFVLNDLSLVIWGGDTFSVPIPESLSGAMWIGPVMYPKYRIFVLVLGILVFAA
jgi:branched-chain amino acid transport system permease protein